MRKKISFTLAVMMVMSIMPLTACKKDDSNKKAVIKVKLFFVPEGDLLQLAILDSGDDEIVINKAICDVLNA